MTTKFVPILALTAAMALAPTQKAEAWWHGGGWRWWGPAVAVGVPLTVAATRPYYYYGPGPYYPYSYYGGPYYYRRGYSVSASVQARLAAKGFYHGPVDGRIGPVSREAIRSYQSSRGLPVTGHINRSLLHSLRLG